MKTNNVLYALIIALIISSNIRSVSAMDRGDAGLRFARFDRAPSNASKPEIIKWVGEVRDNAASHTTEHEHALTFVKKDDGKTYDIVDSLALVKLHHETEKNYLVEIEAEKTPRFLFWGGNLVVSNYRVIGELGNSVPHNEPNRSVARQSIGDRR